MRGKEWYLQGESPAPGITPAYAGKRRCPRFRPGKIRDHPRVCGEKVSSTSPIKCLKGSPPRVRGKGQAACEIVVELGITPAYAGKRSYGCGTEQCGRDHPRVCGEKSKPKPGKDRRMESPPRVRGKGVRLPPLHVPAGITPAYAGKSARRQAGPPGPAPPPQMRSGWSPPPCTGRQCRTRKSTHARRARIPAPAHTPAPQ